MHKASLICDSLFEGFYIEENNNLVLKSKLKNIWCQLQCTMHWTLRNCWISVRHAYWRGCNFIAPQALVQQFYYLLVIYFIAYNHRAIYDISALPMCPVLFTGGYLHLKCAHTHGYDIKIKPVCVTITPSFPVCRCLDHAVVNNQVFFANGSSFCVATTLLNCSIVHLGGMSVYARW